MSAASEHQKKRMAKISKAASEEYNKKGNKKSWQQCIKDASKKIK